ncbi:MAG: DUF4350 domain-containing protein [Bacteroidia bacterium]|nr:DUF4350 domain-containing protein [Bacteroidia bacterium]
MKQIPLHKKLLWGIATILAIITLYGIFSQSFGAKKFSWRESFARKSKTPYGTFLVYEMLGNLFDTDSVKEIKTPVFDQLVYQNYSQSSYIFINENFPVDETDVDEMVSFVKQGNNIFIAAYYFPDALKNRLGFENLSYLQSEEDSLDIHFLGEEASKNYRFPGVKMINYFNSWNEDRTKVLAETTEGYAKLLEISIGEGRFFLSTDPRIFTNYYMIHPQNHQYISRVFSLLPENQTVFWDEYYKIRNLRSQRGNDSQDRPSAWDYIMEQEALRWGFWVFLVAIFLYAVFEGKRTQRLVPVIKPLPNTTIDFTETIGRLYYQSADHKKIATKRIKVLLEYIRSRFFLKTHVFDDEFIRNLSGKSGLPEADIRDLCQMIGRIRDKGEISEEELIALNRMVEDFYQKV